MDVLVVGGTGFVGQALCRTLDERRHTVTAASRSAAAGESPETVRIVSLDGTQTDLTDALSAVSAESVVNLVALASHIQPREQSYAVHSDGTRNLVRAYSYSAFSETILITIHRQISQFVT